MPDNLPRIIKVLDLEPEEKICCGQEMKQVGVDEREVLECLPAIFFVVKYLIAKYNCPICGGDEGCLGAIATADTPVRILPGSSAGNSVVAEVVANKIVDGLPGYRQAKRFERFGLGISRRTITNWLLSVAKKCHILDKLLWESLFTSDGIQMDETYIQVLGEKGRDNRTKSYMWVMRGILPGKRIVYFAYHPTRASSVPRALLKGFKGVVQTDGYKGYDFLEGVEDVILVACWAHVRRKFSDIIKAMGKNRKKSKRKTCAEEALQMIRKLYAVEKQAKKAGLSIEQLRALRAEKSKPTLEEFRTWLEQHVSDFPESSKTGKAIRYALRLWPRLTPYADTGIVPIDNNGVENVIRPFVVGRKAFLFAGSPDGAAAIATLFSLVETARANGWEPYAYLRFLFDHLPNAIGETEQRNLLPHIAQPIPTSVYVDEDRQRLQEGLASEPAPV